MKARNSHRQRVEGNDAELENQNTQAQPFQQEVTNEYMLARDRKMRQIRLPQRYT